MVKIPVRNIGAKIIALIVAIFLWVYITNEQNPQIEAVFNIPLEVRNLSDKFSLTDVPETVKVKVRGARNVLVGELLKNIKAYIDLNGLGEGKNSIKTQVMIPDSLDLVETNPDKVTVQLDSPTVRQIGLDVKVTGSPGQGLMLARTAVRPSQVTIGGARATLESIERAAVSIDISGKVADFSIDVPVQLFGRDGKKNEKLTPAPEKITVSFFFGPEVSKKLIDIKPLIVQLPTGIPIKSITTEPEKISISGSREAIEKVEYVFTEPITLTTITKDTVLEVKLQSKEGIVLAQQTIHLNVKVSH